MGSERRITPQSFAVTRKDREALNGHKGRLLWQPSGVHRPICPL